MKIKHTIISSFLVNAMISIFFSSLILLALFHIKNHFEELTSAPLTELQIIPEINLHIFNIDSNLHQLYVSPDQPNSAPHTHHTHALDQIHTSIAGLQTDKDQLLTIIKNTVTKKSDNRLNTARKLDIMLNSYINAIEGFMEISSGHEAATMTSLHHHYNSKISPKSEMIRSTLKKIIEMEKDDISGKLIEVDKASNYALIILFLSILLSGTIAIGIGLFIARLITKPIDQLRTIMTTFGQGFITIPDHQLAAKDEIGDLARSFNLMIIDLELSTTSIEKLNTEIAIRKKIESNLLMAKTEWERTFNSVPDLIFIVDTNYKIVRANRAMTQKLAIERNEIQGLYCFNIIHGTDKPPNTCPHQNIFHSVSGFSAEEYNDRFQGYYHITMTPLKDHDDKFMGTVHIFRDITDKKKAEQLKKIRQLEKIQSEKLISLKNLLKGVGHQINNPNNFISLNADMLHEAWHAIAPIIRRHAVENPDFLIAGLPGNEFADHFPKLCQGISDGSLRIKNIINSMHEFTFQDDYPLEPGDLQKVIETAVSMMADEINNSTGNFQLRTTADIPQAKISHHQMVQVVINLLKNSCQALTDRQQAITLCTFCDNTTNSTVLEISDQGCGIKQEDLKFITDPFFTTKHEKGAPGLGLAISIEILKKHGGKLLFESQQGSGTTARVHLPWIISPDVLMIP